MIIWLQGPSGGGKSTVGRLLAAARGLPFVDLDTEVEQAAGKSVLDIFWHDGEPAFRRMEWNALLAVMERDRAPKVIALGGGAVVDPAVRAMMRSSGLRIFVDVDPAVALARLEADTPRPLLYEEDPAATWRRLYNNRLHFYHEADAVVRADGSAADVAAAIGAAVDELMIPAWSADATIAGEASRVEGYAALFAVAERLRAIAGGRPLGIIADETVARYFGDYLFPDDDRTGITTLTVPSGEEAKTLRSVEDLAAGLVAAGLTREGMIVGIGGGVVTDMAGFVASVYMRGVPCVYVPTTLLAQVDAAIGGKTAINAAGMRNLLGAYRQPAHVLVTPSVLHTLPARELRSGFVESLKMGIINSAPLADAVSAAVPAVLAGEVPANIGEVIRLSIRAKLDVVEQDAHDAGLRLSLNFGHTFGHALEAAEPGAHAHGEAVAFGMIAAAAMACERGAVSASRRDTIAALALPFTGTALRARDHRAVLRAMLADKKREHAGIRFVLPTEETGFTLATVEDRDAIVRAMQWAEALGAGVGSPEANANP